MSSLPPPSRAPVSIERLLASMERLEASDLFITEGMSPAVRRHGLVHVLNLPAVSPEDLQAFLVTRVSQILRDRLDATGDIDVGVSLETGGRFRVNLGRQMGHLGLVARALPSGDLDIADLGLPPVVKDLANRARGLILVTGATGSGKSTTLAAMVHHINCNRKCHIVTIEDPIEFVHRDRLARVTQREVGADTSSFDSALRHVLRQSPDVILVGEVRDRETVQVALSAALTGHLVLASLHTIDATQTLQRVLSLYPEYQRAQAALDLSMGLVGILSQRLVPPREGEKRIVAVESLVVTPPAARLIQDLRVEELRDLMRASSDPGICTFNSALLSLFHQNRISFEVGRSCATNPDEFSLAARGMSSGVEVFRGDDASAVSTVDLRALLAVAMERGASDLHLTEGRTPILRTSAGLMPLGDRLLGSADMRMLLFSVLSARQRSIYELEKEIDFALALEDGRRFRVNAYFQKGRMAMALRAIAQHVPSADDLNLPPEVVSLGERPQGLLLVVGPTGSGKSTTLACLLDRICHGRSCRIITVEDPIEYVHEGAMATVDQREVHADTESFSAALRYILRQDPDVILVGEMRDLEAVSAALTAAETGHLVLATLHANDAPQTIDRIVDVFPPHQQGQVRSQLAASLIAVVSQRLIPRKDAPGRIPAFEVMVATPAIRTMIRDNRMHQALGTMETSRGDGMVTLDHYLRGMVGKGQIALEEAMRFARNPALLAGGKAPQAPLG